MTVIKPWQNLSEAERDEMFATNPSLHAFLKEAFDKEEQQRVALADAQRIHQQEQEKRKEVEKKLEEERKKSEQAAAAAAAGNGGLPGAGQREEADLRFNSQLQVLGTMTQNIHHLNEVESKKLSRGVRATISSKATIEENDKLIISTTSISTQHRLHPSIIYRYHILNQPVPLILFTDEAMALAADPKSDLATRIKDRKVILDLREDHQLKTLSSWAPAFTRWLEMISNSQHYIASDEISKDEELRELRTCFSSHQIEVNNMFISATSDVDRELAICYDTLVRLAMASGSGLFNPANRIVQLYQKARQDHDDERSQRLAGSYHAPVLPLTASM